MIRNNDYSRMLVGVGGMLAARYNLPDDSAEKGYTQKEGMGLYIADGEGGYRQPTYSLGVTETPYGIVMAERSFVPGMVHRVYGTVTPATEQVHITGPGGFVEYYHRPGDLLKNEWTDAPVVSDGKGGWSVNVDWLVGGPKTIYAFCLREPTLEALATCKVTIDGVDFEPDTEVMAELDSGVKKLALIPVTVENTTGVELNGSELEVRVTGTCPSDAGTVYMWNYGNPMLTAYAGTFPYGGLGESVELKCSYYNPAASLGADRLIPMRNYRVTLEGTLTDSHNSRYTRQKRMNLLSLPAADGITLVDPEKNGFALEVKTDFTATFTVADAERFKEATGLEWTSGCMGGHGMSLELICEADEDWNRYWQRPSTETNTPENICPVCHGSGCAACCHTGLELDGDFYRRHFASYSYFSGYGAVRNGRFEIKTSGARLQMNSWQVLMFISEQSRNATAQLEIIDSYPPCLSGDTLITMADGSTKPLRELKFGDMVLSGDGEATAVISTSRGRFSDHHTLYTFEDGTVIDESADHRFFNVDLGYWAWLKDWRIGDRAVALGGPVVHVDGAGGTALQGDGSLVSPTGATKKPSPLSRLTALVKVERIDEPAECFGLWTESRDYWAGGLLSGETMANQRLLADATAEQAAEMLASIEPEMVREMMA